MRHKIFSDLILLVLLLSIQATTSFALDDSQYPEVKRETRNKVALSLLKKEADAVAIYARGLCCPSCAIGIRVMVSKLDFVDQSRFNKGVELDAKHQIVTVAIKDGHTYSSSDLTRAISNAGYDAMILYTLKKGFLHTESLHSEN